MPAPLLDRREFLGATAAALALPKPRWLPRPPAVDHMAWWQQARFGMFVHFGLYSMLGGEWQGKPAGTHEWIRHNGRIPNDVYARLARQFNPVDFDADALAALAAAAGQRYLVFTTKHHDGFSLFDSRHTDYDMMATPSRRDLAREVADACRRHGIVPCWYYSIMDWNHPDYLPRRDWEAADRPAGMASYSRYLDFMLRQLEELLTRYGDIGLLWFDGPWEGSWTHEKAVITAERCRALSPRIIINNRVDKAGRNPFLPAKYSGGSDQWRSARSVGDYSTPELGIPDTGAPGEPWESCITMNNNWGYSRFDSDFKSAARLIEILVETASKGGNLLLNVGPDGTGRIPEQSVIGLREMGRWMAVHGEAIHGTAMSPYPDAPVRITTSGNRLNCFVPAEHRGDVVLPLQGARIQRAWLMADAARTPLVIDASGNGSTIAMPKVSRDPICDVVVVESGAFSAGG